jgi:hypothetical protein
MTFADDFHRWHRGSLTAHPTPKTRLPPHSPPTVLPALPPRVEVGDHVDPGPDGAGSTDPHVPTIRAGDELEKAARWTCHVMMRTAGSAGCICHGERAGCRNSRARRAEPGVR